MHLWNCDETSFNGDKGGAKEMTRRGAKSSLVLFTNQRIDFMAIGLKEAHQTHFTQHHYLVGWNVIFNVSLSVALKCKENKVTLICIPAHSSHILQPLNVCVFCYVEVDLSDILSKFIVESGFSDLSKKVFPSLLAQLYSCNKTYTRSKIIAGFESTGLFSIKSRQH